MSNLIGRKKEIATLQELYDSNQAQFIAIYGRRRVGKTFLVDEALKEKITFRHAGLSPVDEKGKQNLLKEQLKQFYLSLQLHGMSPSKCPTSWLEAFFMLEKWLIEQDNGEKQVVFLDEIPWMDTPKSGFMTAFEGFWNNWACHRPNMMLIVCGSANSWILDNLVNNHGGLYGRVTYEMKLTPFTLEETEEFFRSRGFSFSRYDIVQCQMILGGIPYYLNYFRKELSLPQNIDRLFFAENPKLRDEYDRLFASVFSSPNDMKKIVECIGSKRSGATRKEIAKTTGIVESGNQTKMMKALIASDFVTKYLPFGANKREEHYKLTDPFCIFYLKFLRKHESRDPEFWTHNENMQQLVSWRGFAFEEVCLRHISQIKDALGIRGVVSSQSSWSLKGNENEDGSQIDLLIDRDDNIVNMCEMKFYSDTFAVDKDYERTIVRRVNLLSGMIPKKKAVRSTLITTYGLARNEYSRAFQQVVTMDDLFIY